MKGRRSAAKAGGFRLNGLVTLATHQDLDSDCALARAIVRTVVGPTAEGGR